MRKLTGHIVNPCNDKLHISVLDEPGAGGACHSYNIGGYQRKSGGDVETCVTINFQDGPIATAGVNGVTHEALLEILIDRLRSFQAGRYACLENETALAKLYEAQLALKIRTLARMERGVEGTHTV